MPVDDGKLDEVRTIIRSLLLARQGSTAISVLDNDYYESECEHIPWRKFGYVSVMHFLESMPQYCSIENRNGCYYVHGLASEKTKHVSSLVARQKQTPKGAAKNSHYRHRSNVYVPYVQRPRVRIPSEQLNSLVQYVQRYPDGISIQTVIQIIQKEMPHVTLSVYDIQQQLRELTHQLYLDGDLIFPKHPRSPEGYNGNNGYAYRASTNHQPLQPSSLEPQKNVARSTTNIAYDVSDKSDTSDFNSSDLPDDINHLKPESAKRFRTSLNRAQNFKYHESNSRNDTDYFANTEATGYIEKNDMSALISDRVRSRLKQLIQSHPEGIRCAELPEMYLREYKVSLNYANLGFNSVCEYVSHLQDIFYVTQQDSHDDFILYSADEKLNNQEMSSKKHVQGTVSRTEPIEVTGSRNLYDMDEDDAAPFLDSAKIVSDKVMSYNDCISQILVTDLQYTKEYLEVCIVEIFTPSCFWVQLRRNMKHFEMFMKKLSEFYEHNKEKYVIPKTALERGLNCACIYDGLWHRGIIKTVKPDFKVMVLFYDYGTLKTYNFKDIYYLHKQFSYLPAQAILCGLYNVIPCVGDRWEESVTDQFINRVLNHLLVATIASVDPKNNSMLIILSDTSKEEDVHINDWLVHENLAHNGKITHMLTYKNFLFHCYMTCEVKNINKVQYDQSMKNQSISHNEKTHRLSNVENESTEKNVKALHNSPISKKNILQMLKKNDSTMETPVDAKPQNEKRKGPKELVMLLEKLKVTSSNSSTNASQSSMDSDLQDNAQQIGTEVKIKPRINNKSLERNWKEEEFKMKFTIRDSDDEEDNKENDFGTFQSLNGGNGMMEPFDWSVLKNDSPVVTSGNSNVGLDKALKNSNEAKDKYVKYHKFIHDQKSDQKNDQKLVTKQYFFNLTRKEEEYFLADTNVDYDKDTSQAVAQLKNRSKIHNDKYTPVTVSKKILELLRGNVQSQDMSNSDANVSAANGPADVPSANISSADVPSANVSFIDVPSTDVPSADVSFTDVPSADVSSTDVPSTDVPSTDVLSADVSSTDVSFADISSADVSSANIDDVKWQRPNMSNTPRMLQQILKMQQKKEQSELDSDDLSDQDSYDSEKNEPDDEHDEPNHDTSMICDSTRNNDDMIIPDEIVPVTIPVFDDCDLQSTDESEWDITIPNDFLKNSLLHYSS